MADKQPVPGLPFASDGSFFEQFQRLQQQQQQQQQRQQQEMEQREQAAALAERQQQQELAGPSVASAPTPELASEPAQLPEPSGDFMPSTSFTGARQGWIFKADERGLGYYKDVGLEGWLSKRQEQARAKPVAIKANKSIAKVPLRGGSEPASKKAKTGDKPKYLREMETYRSLSCDTGKGTNRPLVK